MIWFATNFSVVVVSPTVKSFVIEPSFAIIVCDTSKLPLTSVLPSNAILSFILRLSATLILPLNEEDSSEI